MTLFEYIAWFYNEGFIDTRSMEGVDRSVTLIANNVANNLASPRFTEE